jgi:SAM-dependent methyltransferase
MPRPHDNPASTAVDVPTGNTYDKYASGNPIERRLMSGFFAALDRMLPAEAPKRILEVGAGEGEVTRRLRARYADATVLALDLPDPALASTWTDWPGVFGSADHLPFPDDAFDLVLAIEVLEHVTAPEACVGELARVSKSRVVASVPREPLWRALNLARLRYVRDLGNTPGHVQHWSRRSFTRLLSGGLHVDQVATPIPWTMATGRPR